MTEFERKLQALTPAPADRDALLFAAGRASAASPRAWQWACGLLAVTQLVTLAALLRDRPEAPPPLPDPPTTPTLPPGPPPDPSSYLVLLRTWDQPPAAAGGDGAPDPAPLTAGSRSF